MEEVTSRRAQTGGVGEGFGCVGGGLLRRGRGGGGGGLTLGVLPDPRVPSEFAGEPDVCVGPVVEGMACADFPRPLNAQFEHNIAERTPISGDVPSSGGCRPHGAALR